MTLSRCKAQAVLLNVIEGGSGLGWLLALIVLVHPKMRMQHCSDVGCYIHDVSEEDKANILKHTSALLNFVFWTVLSSFALA